MDFNHYTQKSLEAVQLARNLAVQQGQQQLEQIHLLSALLQQENGLIPQLLKKMGVTVESLAAAVQAEVEKLPKVSGSVPADAFYISREANDALNAAENLAKQMKDEYISVEHLFLGLLETAEGAVKGLFHT